MALRWLRGIPGQLPSLVDLCCDDRFGIADLIVGLQQRHHRQERRRQRRRPARLIGGANSASNPSSKNSARMSRKNM